MPAETNESPRPRVLFFTPYALAGTTSGGARRSSLFHDCLERHADLFTVHHTREIIVPASPHEAAVKVRAGIHRFYDRRLLRVLRSAVESFQPDLVWAEMFYSVPMLASVAREAGIPLVFNSQNVEVERFSAWSAVHRAFIRRYEALCLRRADWVVCVSERDRNLFASLYGTPPERMRVLPNGFDDAEWQPGHLTGSDRDALLEPFGFPPDAPVALFFGSHHYRPNADALEVIESRLAPELATRMPQARILVLGPGSEGRVSRHAHVAYGGPVPDLRPYLHASDLLLCPLRHGGGSRLKIIESLACGLPTVSTAKGAEGLESLGEESGLYRAELAEFAGRAAELLEKRADIRPMQHSEPLRVYALSTICVSTAALLQEAAGRRG